MAQSVKNPPAIQETWVRPLGWEGMEDGMATRSSILARRIATDRGAWRAASCGITKGQMRLSTAVVVLFVLKKGKSSQNLQSVSLDSEKNG